MKTFHAVLTRTIKFLDISGRWVVLKKGARVLVSISMVCLVSSTLDGKRLLEPAGAIIGSVGQHSFDLSPAEFAAVN